MLAFDPATQAELDAAAGASVALTGDQTIAGVKTFTSQPVLPQRLTRGTAVATTSGTSIDFTGIPSWVRRIILVFDQVSTNGSSVPQVQLGAGSIETTGYNSVGTSSGTGSATTSSTTGLVIHGSGAGGASAAVSGHMVLTNVTGNVWVASFIGASGTVGLASCMGGGSKTLGGTLDRLRLTTVGGTETFDAGQLNILYE
jgi:hypothetical protein